MTSVNPEPPGQHNEETSGHTPGPWKVIRSGGWMIYAGHHVPVATVATGVIEGAYKTTAIEANATLLAAAPELLEACKLALPEINGREYVAACVDDGISPELRRLWATRDALKTAIAKAEGKKA